MAVENVHNNKAEYSKWWNSVLENRRKLRKSRVAHVENRISLADQIRLQRQALIQDKDDLPLGASATDLQREDCPNYSPSPDVQHINRTRTNRANSHKNRTNRKHSPKSRTNREQSSSRRITNIERGPKSRTYTESSPRTKTNRQHIPKSRTRSLSPWSQEPQTDKERDKQKRSETGEREKIGNKKHQQIQELGTKDKKSIERSGTKQNKEDGKEATPKIITPHPHMDSKSEHNTEKEIISSYNRSDTTSAPLTHMRVPPTRDATHMSSFSLPINGSKQNDKGEVAGNNASGLLPKRENWISWDKDDYDDGIVHDTLLINEPQERISEQRKMSLINNYQKKHCKSNLWKQRSYEGLSDQHLSHDSRGLARFSLLPEQTNTNNLWQPGGKVLMRRYASPHPLKLLQGRTQLSKAEIQQIEEWIDDDLSDIIYRFRDY